jgi:methyl-accepting chemotaxis protein
VSIRKMMKVLYAAGAVSLVGLVVVTVLLVQNQRSLTSAEENRYTSYLLADELRQSSDDLTRLARTYVVTGEKRYEDDYWKILDVRNGKTPRADGRTVALKQLMQNAGFTDAEFGRLEAAERNSNGLVTTETIAMNAVKGQFDDGRGGYTNQGAPDAEMARRIMFDEKYHADKALIMAPIAEFDRMLDDRTKAAVATYVTRSYVYLSLLGLFVLFGGGVAFALVRYMNTTLTTATGELREIISQVATASTQVATSSQTLSQGATTQAASLEETSASMEEMASMTRKNAENSQSAAATMADTERLVHGANTALGEMVTSMAAIKESSDKVAKIIKTIDEIAFQTNILALNAAVEAARAGEAGMGFAVVADEVRALAQRSAQAAKDTASLIEESIAKSNEGQHKVRQVTTAIESITSSTVTVKRIVDEVSDASRQQSQGIDQVSQAIAQMEKVTQGTAATAEESAAASEELSALGEMSMSVVARLAALVGSSVSIAAAAAAQAKTPVRPTAKVVAMKTQKLAKMSRPEQEIPLGDTGTFGSF